MEYRAVKAGFSQLAEPIVNEPAADLRRIASVIRRCLPFALAGIVLAVSVAAVFLVLAQPSYRSTVRLLLDQEGNQFLNKNMSNANAANGTPTEDFVDTQIAVINSDLVARRVIKELGLAWDPQAKRLFSSPLSSDRSGAATLTSAELASADIDPSAVIALSRSLTVQQIDKSLVIEIALRDSDPVLAQKMAAAYGNAYLNDQLDARYEATRNAGAWLEKRIDTLREQSLEANNAVEAFRAENNLVSTDGRLVSDQLLQQLNAQLSDARSAVTRAAAKVRIFEEAIKQNNINAVIGSLATNGDIPETAPIRTLRDDYLQAVTRAQDIDARWGGNNEQATAIQAEITRLSRLILAEAARTLEGFREELRVAQSAAQAVQDEVTKATGQSQLDNSTLVKLRSLEQRSASYNSLYQDYLSRYQEAVQQQTLAMSSARLVSKPEVATSPIFPNKKIILALSLVLGAGLGGAAGLGREMFDRSIRSRNDIEKYGVDFLGYAQATRKGEKASAPGDLLLGTAEEIEHSPALATTRIALDMKKRAPHRLVGVISLAPNLSRSAMALALAQAEAAAGARVLLLDSDSPTSALTRALSDAPVDGEPAGGGEPLSIAPGLHFASAGSDTVVGNGGALRAGEQLTALREGYDLVVVDMPTAGPISKARAMASSFDAFVCVIDWGSTDQKLLADLVQSSSIFSAKIAGAVIARVSRRKLRLYDSEAASALKAAA